MVGAPMMRCWRVPNGPTPELYRRPAVLPKPGLARAGPVCAWPGSPTVGKWSPRETGGPTAVASDQNGSV
jgi:hypothetical protein